MIDLENEKTIKALRYKPLEEVGAEGVITHYSVWAMTDGDWKKVTDGEFSNIINNPIWQTVNFTPVKTKLIRIDGERLSSGSRTTYDDLEVVMD